MIRILNAEPEYYCDEARDLLKSCGEYHEQISELGKLFEVIHEYQVLIVRLGIHVNKELIDNGTKLIAIVTATTGLDHIDIAYAREKGIKVLSLKGELDFLRNIYATAEHTWAILLALLRNITQANASVIAGNWDRDNFRGHELNGKRLGILGFGRIGEKIAKYGEAFEMKVLAYDPYCNSWPDNVICCADLNELISQSDIFSIHIPYNSGTHGIIGLEELELLPEGAILVNTSRGKIIDEKAVIKVLETGHLAGAALDVLASEPNTSLIFESPVISYMKTYSNLLVTPHIGGATWESMKKTEVFMANKLVEFLKNKTS